MVDFSSISQNTLIGKLLRLPLRLVPPEALVPVLQGPLVGAIWMAGSSNHGCWLGSYEKTKQVAIAKRIRRGDVAYDIGANVGFYTLLFSRLVGKNGKVYAFEPVPRNVEVLDKHLHLNGVGNTDVFELAVSDRDGEAPFQEEASNSQGRLSEEGSLTVRSAALDTLISSLQLRPPTCIKVDVEGAEALVLRGARRIILDARPIIFLATHGPAAHHDCLELLAGMEYQIQGLAGGEPGSTDELLAIPSS